VLAAKTAAKLETVVAQEPRELDMATIEKGREIFLTAGDVGCAACHGRYAEGDVGIGPYNRGFSETAIRRALKTVGPMAFLSEELNDEQIDQVAAYYEYLSGIQLVKSLVARGLFVPNKVSIQPGQRIQLVVINGSRVPRIFTSEDMGIADFAAAGRDATDVVWTAPHEEGSYRLQCADCSIKGQNLVFEVTKRAPPYVPPVALK
jgi:cytochrome c553